MAVRSRIALLCVLYLLTNPPVAASDAGPQCPEPADESAVLTAGSVRVVTLNLAHGRKDGRNQMLQRGSTIRENLLQVAQVLNKVEADVVALQEADAESAWSGRFDHVDFLAAESDYPCRFHGVHASNRMYDFGTALLSRQPFQGAFSHSFKPSKPTTTKGFVIGALDWNPEGALPEPLMLKIVSVHLDFSRRSVRRSQVDEMVEILLKIEGPMILLGDFNTDWQTEDSSLKYLAGQMSLQAYQPHAEGLGTYGDKGARLDWILISPDLRFSTYAVVPDMISDHYAVAAEIERDTLP